MQKIHIKPNWINEKKYAQKMLVNSAFFNVINQ